MVSQMKSSLAYKISPILRGSQGCDEGVGVSTRRVHGGSRSKDHACTVGAVVPQGVEHHDVERGGPQTRGAPRSSRLEAARRGIGWLGAQTAL